MEQLQVAEDRSDEDAGLETGAKTTRRPSGGAPRRRPLLKLVTLTVLALQTTAAVLSMRYARTRSGDMFIASTAVVVAEVVKLFASLTLVCREVYATTAAQSSSRPSPKRAAALLYNTIAGRPADAVRVCVPSLMYITQNNLVYAAVANLDAVTFQAVYQLRTLATAAFSASMLKRQLTARQWVALAALVPGVVLVQLNADDATTDRGPAGPQNRAVGLASALGAAASCAFAGVYLEKILKGVDGTSVWTRNAQLSLVSVPLGVAVCTVADWREIAARGFFHGYDPFVVYLVCLQAAGGLIVATVIKYADNILKGYATSFAIVASCAFSAYFFRTAVGVRFAVGVALVVFSVFLYAVATPSRKRVADNPVVGAPGTS